MQDAERNHWLDRFEPLGINCEFGFVAGRLGSNRRSLFRWTFIQPEDLRRLMKERFAGAFDFEHVRPLFQKMVRDTRYNWDFHSTLESDAHKQFILEDAELRRMHRILKIGLESDIKIFTSRLTDGGVVCVLKVKQTSLSEMSATLDAIDQFAENQTNKLLIVTEASDESPTPGNVVEVKPRLHWGIISRVAPPDRAEDADYPNWRLILEHFER